MVQLCTWHQRLKLILAGCEGRQKQRWSWCVLGLSQRRRVLVYCWIVAGALPLMSPSSLQRTLPTALPSTSPSQNVPNNQAPRADFAQKGRQGLLWVGESEGLVQEAHVHIHSHHFFSPSPFCTRSRLPSFNVLEPAVTVFASLALSSRLGSASRVAGSTQRPSPGGHRLLPAVQTTTPVLSRARSPASPASHTGFACESPTVSPIGFFSLSVTWEY